MDSGKRHRHKHRLKEELKRVNALTELWRSFWNPPDEACPRCGSQCIEYYDPLFFSPVRTLKGRRRLKCNGCKFVWRPSRKSKVLWDYIRIRF